MQLVLNDGHTHHSRGKSRLLTVASYLATSKSICMQDEITFLPSAICLFRSDDLNSLTLIPREGSVTYFEVHTAR